LNREEYDVLGGVSGSEQGRAFPLGCTRRTSGTGGGSDTARIDYDSVDALNVPTGDVNDAVRNHARNEANACLQSDNRMKVSTRGSVGIAGASLDGAQSIDSIQAVGSVDELHGKQAVRELLMIGGTILARYCHVRYAVPVRVHAQHETHGSIRIPHSDFHLPAVALRMAEPLDGFGEPLVHCHVCRLRLKEIQGFLAIQVAAIPFVSQMWNKRYEEQCEQGYGYHNTRTVGDVFENLHDVMFHPHHIIPRTGQAARHLAVNNLKSPMLPTIKPFLTEDGGLRLYQSAIRTAPICILYPNDSYHMTGQNATKADSRIPKRHGLVWNCLNEQARKSN